MNDLCGEEISKKDSSGTIKNPKQTRGDKQLSVGVVKGDGGFCRILAEVAIEENWMIRQSECLEEALRIFTFDRPDILFVNACEVDGLGTDSIQKLKCLAPALPIVVLNHTVEYESVLLSVSFGVAGYVETPLSTADIKSIIGSVAAGSPVLSPQAQGMMMSLVQSMFAMCAETGLSSREVQILLGLARGLSDKEISASLKIATNTVHVYLVRLFHRLKVHSRDEVIGSLFRHCLGRPCTRCRLTPKVKRTTLTV